jgi:hypothetical protein
MLNQLPCTEESKDRLLTEVHFTDISVTRPPADLLEEQYNLALFDVVSAPSFSMNANGIICGNVLLVALLKQGVKPLRHHFSFYWYFSEEKGTFEKCKTSGTYSTETLLKFLNGSSEEEAIKDIDSDDIAKRFRAMLIIKHGGELDQLETSNMAERKFIVHMPMASKEILLKGDVSPGFSMGAREK